MATHDSTVNYLASFAGLIDSVLGNQIRHIDQVMAVSYPPKKPAVAASRLRLVPNLPKCAYEETMGPVATFHCGSTAVVTDLDSEQPMCLKHHELVR